MSEPVTGGRGLLATPPPEVTEAEAREAVRRHYGLDADVLSLPGERDRNFLLRDAAGRHRVFKVFNPADDGEARGFQCGVLLHLARSGLRCPTPRLVPTTAGEDQCRLDGPSGPLWGVLVSHLRGVPATALGNSAAWRIALGETAAELDAALAGYDRPGGDRVLPWDMMRLDRLAGGTALVEAGRRRDWIAGFVEAFLTDVRPRTARLRTQVVHNDLNAGNVLVDPADGTVSGLIDFGDMVRAPLVVELAVLANYHLGDGPDPLAALGDLVEGYERRTPLFEYEVAELFDLVLARIAVRILVHARRAELVPRQRDAILRQGAEARRLLDRFIDMPRAQGRDAVLARWAARRPSR